MTHDLTRETLAYLEFQRDDKLRVDANRTAMGMVPTDAWRKDAAMYAHAAECVREVAALRRQVEDAQRVAKYESDVAAQAVAELATLRAKAEIVDAMERRHINVRYLGANNDGELVNPWRVEGVSFRGFAHAPTIATAYAQARAAQEKADDV